MNNKDYSKAVKDSILKQLSAISSYGSFINIVEELSRPVTLAMRLFGNILAGEILMEILYALAPVLVPLLWVVFSLVVGLIQAYIFTTLTSIYLKESVE